jgi:hypothetical protein
MVMAALSLLALVYGIPDQVGAAVLWLLPWGWAAQPLAAATGVSVGPGPLLATALWACALAAAVRVAVRAVPEMTQESLRLRAGVADRVSASLFTLDFRQARAAMRMPRHTARPASRLAFPGHSWLVVPWRDLLSLVRTPGRLGWGVAWSALSTGALVLASAWEGTPATIFSWASVWFLYLAAAQFVEPARLESDDIRRSALLPYGAGALALWHAVVPCLLLLVTTGLGTLLCLVAGRPAPGLSAVALVVPACVGAALVSAYRGPLPLHLLVGTDTPMGNTAPVQTAVCYLRGPLALMLLAVPVLSTLNGARAFGAVQGAWLLLVGAGGLLWARRTARRLRG